MQIGVEGLSLNKLDNYRIYPTMLKELLGNNVINKSKIYLRDISNMIF